MAKPSETKPFHLSDVLTVITGRILCPDGIDGLYAILNWMTGDSLFTHQLARAHVECSPRLLAQHPDLAAVQVPDWPDGVARDTVVAWLDEQVARYGETREVGPMRPEDHTRIDPLTEVEMYKPGGVIIVALDPEG